jgi:hypothetical protein
VKTILRVVRWFAVVGVGVLATVAFTATPAFADNCGSLSDCLFNIGLAVLVIAAIALLIALLLGSGGGGLLAFAGAAGTQQAAASAAAVAVTNQAMAAATAGAAAAAAGLVLQMSSGGMPGNNEKQNDQAADAVKEVQRRLGRRLNKDQIRQLHDELSELQGEGADMGFHEIIELAISWFS